MSPCLPNPVLQQPSLATPPYDDKMMITTFIGRHSQHNYIALDQ